MTISSDHPFLPAEEDRDPVRRLRGRLITPVTLWTAADGSMRAGLTVGSTVIADGEPALLLGLIDPEADVLDLISRTERFAMIILDWADRNLADVFAGLAPAPGGAFDAGTWSATEWGPVRADRHWCGCRVVDRREVGYGVLVTGAIDSVRLAGEGPGNTADSTITSGSLGRLRGRYISAAGRGSVTPTGPRTGPGAQ